MKLLAVLIFLFYVTPGSGHLRWDGLPLSSRAEFATLVLVSLVFLSREPRQIAAITFNRFKWSTLAKPVLVLLCFAKFFSFAWFPLGDGFSACYRSLYQPLDDTSACEKSYESPLIQNHGAPYANITRIDRTVDFGAAPYDWSLPFMNEFPRLKYLWLDRFPFSVSYTARVNDVKEGQYLPIFGIGEITIRLNERLIADVTNYKYESLSAVQLPRGSTRVDIHYEYRDDEISEPESPPAPRGPYARLKVGRPLSKNELLGLSRVRVFGQFVAQEPGPLRVALRDRSGQILEVTDLKDSLQSNNQSFDEFSFAIEFSAALIESEPLNLIVRDRRHDVDLGVVSLSDRGNLTIAIAQSPETSSTGRIFAGLWMNRDVMSPLEATSPLAPRLLLRILLMALDLISLIIICALALIVLRALGRRLATGALLGAVGWFAVNPIYSTLPGFLGGGRELVLPYVLISALIVVFRRQIVAAPLVQLLPLAIVLSTQKVFEHLSYMHPGQGDEWWGKLVFLWRDSDWFANNGYARSVFLEGSLRGGESIFYFRVAPRYLIFIGHLLLGENDTLIALVWVSLGFAAALYLGARFADRYSGLQNCLVGIFVSFICLIFIGDQTIVAFGFFVSSEYPTWLTLFALSAYLLSPKPEHRTWPIALMAGLLASMVQFRPNSVFVALALLPLLLSRKVQRENSKLAALQISSAITTFLIIVALSLIHNLFYGANFVIFTPAPSSDNYYFRVEDLLSSDGVGAALARIWTQLASLMYWRLPNDPSYAIFFWGCQGLLAIAIFWQFRTRLSARVTPLLKLLPLTYIIPMIPFRLSSYYPRLLVTASLLCLVTALAIWPDRAKELSDAK